MSAPTPPPAVINCIKALRADFDRIHVIHECDADCPKDCPDFIGASYDYSDHDEHNADVREDIDYHAQLLVGALDEWLGTR
ncbi:MAG TPA: hypothetical protein VF328_14135 [Mycobacterium sp.]